MRAASSAAKKAAAAGARRPRAGSSRPSTSTSASPSPSPTPARAPIRSLALSVHFKHPDLGMTEYEILSRATAFLLGVDPPTSTPTNTSTKEDDTAATSKTTSHLGLRDAARSEREMGRNYAYRPASGPPGRTPSQLGWLEFCPTKFRPAVHCVASSHVLSPWLWNKYYPQDWVSRIEAKHCAYTLEVIRPSTESELLDEAGRVVGYEPLAKFALNPHPIHHPDGLDLAVIHLKEEETALKHLRALGVEVLHLRGAGGSEGGAKDHFRGERVTFDGFEIGQADAVDGGAKHVYDKDDGNLDFDDDEEKGKEDEEDTRTFSQYSAGGELLLASPERYLASTPSGPLPQGLCGGPVLDADGAVTGVIEGVVPPTHEDAELAGSAAFIPAARVREFLDVAERAMLEKIVPADVFERVCRLREGKDLLGGDGDGDGEHEFNLKGEDGPGAGSSPPPGVLGRKDRADASQTLDNMVKSMREHHGDEQVDAIMNTIRSEREEVVDVLTREGGDLDEVIAKVRQRTRERQVEALSKLAEEGGVVEEGEVEGNNCSPGDDTSIGSKKR